jgi:hypothetical protein
MAALTAEYEGRADPSVIKHAAAHNPGDPRKAIDARLTSLTVKHPVRPDGPSTAQAGEPHELRAGQSPAGLRR